jgi:mono/diheme cytochrome c family protein
MKKTLIIAGCIVMVLAISCNKPRRSPGRAYMPDMAYSTAYETYAPSQERLDMGKTGAHFTGLPVPGTIARGELSAYKPINVIDSTGKHAQSAQLVNPLVAGSIDMKEAERLYLVNCAICHGAKLDGNGPLFNQGNGPYGAKPATLVGDAAIEALSEGQIYHVSTYGKNAMGSYASQMSATQRWMVAAYIKSKQGGGAKDTAAAAGSTMPAGSGNTVTARPDTMAAH